MNNTRRWSAGASSSAAVCGEPVLRRRLPGGRRLQAGAVREGGRVPRVAAGRPRLRLLRRAAAAQPRPPRPRHAGLRAAAGLHTGPPAGQGLPRPYHCAQGGLPRAAAVHAAAGRRQE